MHASLSSCYRLLMFAVLFITPHPADGGLVHDPVTGWVWVSVPTSRRLLRPDFLRHSSVLVATLKCLEQSPVR